MKIGEIRERIQEIKNNSINLKHIHKRVLLTVAENEEKVNWYIGSEALEVVDMEMIKLRDWLCELYGLPKGKK